jgi:hypothetical protein
MTWAYLRSPIGIWAMLLISATGEGGGARGRAAIVPATERVTYICPAGLDADSLVLHIRALMGVAARQPGA